MDTLPREIINNIVRFTEPVNLNYYSYTWYKSRNKHGCYNFKTLNKDVESSIEYKKIVDRFRPHANTHHLQFHFTEKVINDNYNFLYHLQK
mgnify:CR=1 FL=1|tara:strand:- start:313 stop:585 length:273 start_codon:yes stop_codon:yes gene_type:complete